MSYCRWSTDNFKCDIYAYESVYDCYTIHVAANKIVGELPKCDIQLLIGENKDVDKYMEQQEAHSAAMENCTRMPIGLPFDGQSFDCTTLQEFYDKMIELREVGYKFPDYVLESIIEEMNSEQKLNESDKTKNP